MSMKYILLVAIFSYSLAIDAKTRDKRRLDDIEKRLDALEKKVNMLKPQSNTTLKIKDLRNEEVQTFQTRSIASDEKKIDEKQKKEIMKQVDKLKKARSQQQKFLDELMNEN